MAAFFDSTLMKSGEQKQHIDSGPLVGRKRGFKTREQIPLCNGMGHMVMYNEATYRRKKI